MYTFIKVNIVLVVRKTKKMLYLMGWLEIDEKFKYVKYEINENKLKQRVRYRLPKHETIDQLENVFVFVFETHNDQEFAEAFASGLYDVNRLPEKWDRDLTTDELETKRENVALFDGSSGNPVMNILKYISENYGGDERLYVDKDGDEIVNSYRLLLIMHNNSGFDSRVVLNSLVKEITELEITKTARGLISLSFCCGVEFVITVKVPQYVKFTCSKSHIKGSLEKNR